ncbi:MAG TPA: LacI family DNA-binding transcriptional regulator [Spirochaetia bacterium]|nr:LacI family DNA-binding transcriptional regulator [Spirochaetia bacterium]
MARRRATVHEVAAYAKVSAQTVSRVVNGVPRVAARTRERVLAAVKALDYEPNSLARGLVTRRTHAIGVVVYDISNPYYGQMVRGMDDAAFSRGYDLVIGNSDADHRKDLSYLRVFRRRAVDGILASVADPSRDRLEAWTQAACPVVFLDKYYGSEDCSYVTVNNREAALRAVEHLLEIGHRRIGVVTASSTASVSVKERFAGYREALRAGGVEYDPGLTARSERQTEEGGFHATRKLLRGGAIPTALFCNNDAMAIGAMRAIYDAGLDIPGDISVVGFDDVPVAALLRVPLTTVAQPIRRMGAAAVELLTERIEGASPRQPRQIVLDAHLVIRRSTAPPARRAARATRAARAPGPAGRK